MLRGQSHFDTDIHRPASPSWRCLLRHGDCGEGMKRPWELFTYNYLALLSIIRRSSSEYLLVSVDGLSEKTRVVPRLSYDGMLRDNSALAPTSTVLQFRCGMSSTAGRLRRKGNSRENLGALHVRLAGAANSNRNETPGGTLLSHLTICLTRPGSFQGRPMMAC